jgi:error-prone DNA polymerase
LDGTYAPLWCKSNYSFLEGASHPQELVETSFRQGHRALALTDRNGVYGLVRAHEQARQLGFPLVVGAQVTVDPGSTLVLLAQTREGYARLCSLLTLGHQGKAKGDFQVSWSQIADHAADLTALWRPEGNDSSHDELEILADAFRGNAYAMVSRHRWIHDARRERETLDLARRYDLPPVAVTEVLYHHSDRQELQDVLTCIRHRVKLHDAGTRLRPNAEHALKDPAEFLSLYDDRPEWVSRTLEIADRCRFSLAEIEYRYPDEGVPPGYTTASWMRKLSSEGATNRYPEGVPLDVQAQLEKELDLIEDLQYSGYFLTMWEIVQFCRKQGILCQGRGSAANSVVCFCLGITAIDPVRMELLFERFLSKERAEPPDIDLDIEHHRREEVIQHMYNLYGRDRAAMVANVVRYRSRSALREVGKVLNISEVDLDRSSKLLSHHDEGLEGAVSDSGLDRSLAVNRKLTELAHRLKGFPRHLSIHPGGFLLGSETLSRIVPVENATMDNRTVIQWDKTDVETMNLFKVDLLGLGALTHLDYAFRLLKTHYRRELSMATIPAADKAVFDMIGRADTIGVFQIESRAQMSMLPRLKPRNYYDLVIEVSLVRPGPITGGMVHPYLRRRAGQEEKTYPHPSLEPVLAKTFGIPLFQEQVMRLAMVVGGYTPGEADQLRRDMAAWKQLGRIEEHHDKLVGRMIANGIKEEFAERVFGQIRGFGEYGFPESHAASFALIAYATAWMKCHYPDVFACALLNAWPMGFYAPATIIGDAKRHGVSVLPPDIKLSTWDCCLEKQEGHSRFAVRMGLRYIRGLVRGEAERILSFRTAGAGLSLGLWKEKSGVSTETWEKLAVSGALEGLGVHRRNALWEVLDQASPGPLAVEERAVREFAEPTAGEAVLWDYLSMDHSVRAHLLQQFRPLLRRARYKAAVEVNAMGQPRIVRYAGLVICRQMPHNAKGVLFLTLEDETGMVNLVVWKKIWDRFRKVILTSSFLGVEGKLQMEEGVTHLVADRFWTPEGFLHPTEVPRRSYDFR